MLNKDILTHLTSFEAVLVDILRELLNQDVQTPALDGLMVDYENFNEREVQARRNQPAQALIDEYEAHHAEVIRLIQ